MAMDLKRKGEIALAIIRSVWQEMLSEEDILSIERKIKEEVESMSEKSKIPEEDLIIFIEEELKDLSK